MRQKTRSRCAGVWGKKPRREGAKIERKENAIVGKTLPVCTVHTKAEFVLKNNVGLAHFYLPTHFECSVGRGCKIQIFLKYMSVT